MPIVYVTYTDSFLLIEITATECSDLKDPPNGQVFLTGTTVSSTATYICDNDFRLQGERNRVCQVTSEWSGEEPTCVRKANIVTKKCTTQ